ncbi:TIGR03790 family protein [Nibricoccus aquaticus]|nr:TIGR03790 family protein [Nibricoccus aquaticus]
MALLPGYFLRVLLAGLAVVMADRTVARAVEDDAAKRVIVLANASSAESMRLARYYAEKRAIPAENIVALPMTLAETIGWREFVDTVYQPLQDELIKRGWVEATGSTLTDEVGRKKYAVLGHRVSYLVTCRGVPLRVEHDQSLYAEVKPLTGTAAFRTNHGAVDAELALVARSGYPINAYVPNPLFQKERPTSLDLGKVIKVSRLDGPGLEAAMGLVDHAIEAEKRGLIGRGYVDVGGPHPEGDQWMEDVVKQLTALDYDMSVDRAPETMSAEARFDAPALYFGWYAWQVNGPFTREGFRFPPGAVALHIHSFSAETLSAVDRTWTGPLVARGVTATVGNVYEPYLTFTHHPHLLLRALARGETWGDAVFYSLRAVSWQCVAIGDPLYRPFKVRFAEQWVKRAELPNGLYPYVILREVRRLERAGQPEQAAGVLREALKERPGMAVLEARLTELSEGGGRAEAK